MQYVSVESRESTAIVRIDRPPANAMNPELLEEIVGAADTLSESLPDAVVMIGREGFFSAGLDLNLVPTLDSAGQAAMIMAINLMVAAWYGFPRPVVGAINGHAIAGGVVLALCADYRVGATEGKLGLTETRVGVPYPANALGVVTAELSPPAARYLVMRAHLVDPPEALRLGLVDELARPDAVLDRACEMAAELGAMPSDAYATVKQQLRGRALAVMQQVVASGTDPVAQGWLSAEVERKG